MRKLSDSEVSMISGGGTGAFVAGVGMACFGVTGLIGAGIFSITCDIMQSIQTVKARDASKSGEAETTKKLSEAAVSCMKGKYIAQGVVLGCVVLGGFGVGMALVNC